MLISALSTKPLLYAELLLSDDEDVYRFLVWVTFLMFLAGTVSNMVAGIAEHNWYNTGGLLLEIVGTLIATPEIFARLRNKDKDESSCAGTLFLLLGGLIFVAGLRLEYVSIELDMHVTAGPALGAKVGLLLTACAFLPFTILSGLPKSSLSANNKALQWLVNGIHILILFLAARPFFITPGIASEPWGFPLMLLFLFVMEDMLELSIARDNDILDLRLMLVCLGIVLVRTGLFFQLVAVHLIFHPLPAGQ